ncbi:MAG: YeeE/YedE thiosulfate transporter family protein [Flavobacteriia bacterium]|jgi:uncharacterized membrane protein YedE/YeeE
MLKTIITIILGAVLGIVLTESQAISWYRIQEMFYFKSFHMYGLLGSAIATGAISLILLKKFKLKSIYNNPIVVKDKPLTWKANLFGGILFGLGWGLTGACSAPLFILVGLSWELGIILLIGALSGTFFYALLKDKIPH